MKVSSYNSKALVLNWKKVKCSIRVGDESLPQAEEYLRILFTSHGRLEQEMDRRIGASSAVVRALFRSVVVKKEMSLSIYWSIFVPTLTYSPKIWVETERTRSSSE